MQNTSSHHDKVFLSEANLLSRFVGDDNLPIHHRKRLASIDQTNRTSFLDTLATETLIDFGVATWAGHPGRWQFWFPPGSRRSIPAATFRQYQCFPVSRPITQAAAIPATWWREELRDPSVVFDGVAGLDWGVRRGVRLRRCYARQITARWFIGILHAS